MFSPVRWREDALEILDQTELPWKEVWRELRSWEDAAEAIRKMRVRGAPLIGIVAAYGLVLAVGEHQAGKEREVQFWQALEGLKGTRPTAVNLFHALERLRKVFERHRDSPGLRDLLLAEARAIHREEVQACRAMGRLGATLLPNRAKVVTICNTGALATGGYGTALGVVRAAWEEGKLSMVYPLETRPRLQGARLTAWELLREGIPFRLIADSAAGWLLVTEKIDAVLVGADRIARNGDTANKIGTYTLAVLARRHGVPFYVVAPTSTIDPSLPTGAGIPIEERDEGEVLSPYGMRFAPVGAPAWNPAFDVTPAELITAIITERGILWPPFSESIGSILS
ncbi:S-methyl-5-thioribose-1-phosphate isomerase [Candidatus Bipolaricaulota bacterium]|nr:S-methyl-5-thioribose-1-phosphate isomerase [Candidatus Bipolaricaulota bacterium]